MESLQFVGWGVCEISFCVGERGVDWGCFGDCVKPFMSTYSYVYKWGTFFDMYNVYWKNYIIYGLSLRCYYIIYTVLHIWVLLFNYTYCKSVSSKLEMLIQTVL